MKRIVLITLLILVLATGTASAMALGLSFGVQPLGGLPGSNVMLSARFDGMPFLMGLGFSVGQDTFALGFTGDYIMYRTNLVNFLNLYAGPGFFLGLAGDVSAGLRIPVALYIMPIDPLELFLEFAPAIGATFSDPVTFPAFGLQGAFGFRFHF